ncbi:MAG TPA: hypothetical protein VFY85_09640 [Gemmatimonadaceae bacterium]|nr:hypothetical protein [Gemmatimonadaceae bacterium]
MPTLTLRPALAALAAAPDTTTIRKLWKALTPEERALGINAALDDDENGWVKTSTRGAVAGALRFRPQTVATWPRAKLVSEAARLPLDNVQLLSAFLIDLHLGRRRPMMASFLDSLGIPNDDGRIDSEMTEVPPQDEATVVAAANDLATRFPPDEVATYFLTLLLQDAQVWKGLTGFLEGKTQS